MTKVSMPEPKPGKVPLQVNIYKFAQVANSKLAPVFPYHGPGDIVPTAAVMDDEGGADPGYFLHYNSVDEIAMCFGSTGGRFRSGQVAVGAREHGVGGRPEPGIASIMTVTQRQSVGKPQEEAIGFPCTQCRTEVYRYAFPVVHNEDPEAVKPLDTIVGSYEAARRYNADPALRDCPSCGHANEPFPHELWGWAGYVRNSTVSESGRRALGNAVEA